MPATIQSKRTDTAGTAPTALAHGELAINTADRKLWVGDNAGAPVEMLALELSMHDIGTWVPTPAVGLIEQYVNTIAKRSMDQRFLNVIRVQIGATGPEAFYIYSNRMAEIGTGAPPALATDFVQLSVAQLPQHISRASITAPGATIEAAVNASAQFSVAADIVPLFDWQGGFYAYIGAYRALFGTGTPATNAADWQLLFNPGTALGIVEVVSTTGIVDAVNTHAAFNFLNDEIGLVRKSANPESGTYVVTKNGPFGAGNPAVTAGDLVQIAVLELDMGTF